MIQNEVTFRSPFLNLKPIASTLDPDVENNINIVSNQDLLPEDHVAYIENLKISPKIIYDIGSCVLHWERHARRIWPSADIYLFDANLDVKNLYDRTNQKYHLGVLTDVDGKTVKFYEDPLKLTGSSYYKENSTNYNENHGIHRVGVTLDYVAEKNNWPQPDLIKLDVQGAEMDILKGAVKCLEKCNDIILESQHVEYNSGAPFSNDVIDFMKSIGFELVSNFSKQEVDGDYHFRKINRSEIEFYSLCFPGKPAKMRMKKQTDLMLGAAIHNIYNAAYSHDDTEDNISDKNNWFGQTTGIYWVWKNINADYVGFCTYRLFWNEEEISKINLDENTLIIPKPVDVRISIENVDGYQHSVLSHYTHCHGKALVPLLYGLCKVDDIPITIDMIDSLKNQIYLHPFSMFIASNKIKNKICSILFDVLFKFYDQYSYLFSALETNTQQNRMLDFLAERILHIIYKNIEYFIPGTKVHEVSIINLPH